MFAPSFGEQLKEALRVLKPDSIACFSVHGRPEKSLQLTIVNEARRNLGLSPAPIKSLFTISENLDEVK